MTHDLNIIHFLEDIWLAVAMSFMAQESVPTNQTFMARGFNSQIPSAIFWDKQPVDLLGMLQTATIRLLNPRCSTRLQVVVS